MTITFRTRRPLQSATSEPREPDPPDDQSDLDRTDPTADEEDEDRADSAASDPALALSFGTDPDPSENGDERFPLIRKKDRKRNAQPDPATLTLNLGSETTGRDLALILDAVRYGQFTEMTVPRFLLIRNCVLLTRFFGLSPTQIAAKIGQPVPEIERALASMDYRKVDAAVQAATRSHSEARSIEDVAKGAEVRIANEMLFAGLTSSTASKNKLPALDGLMDRVAPKKPRDSGKGGSARQFPPDLIAMIELGMDLGERRNDRKRPAPPQLLTATIETASPDDDQPQPPTPALPANATPDAEDAEIIESDGDAVDASRLNVPE